MKKNIIILAVIVLIVAILAGAYQLFKPNGTEEENKVEVSVKGTSIIYDGPMAEEGVAKAKSLYTDKINRLVLNSPGGEINIGMDLGEWVYDKGLDVEINKIAFSSAANYVFTAGKNKYLHQDSMVGWHGGVTQEGEGFLTKLFMKKYIEDGKVREKAFFKKIGVDQRSTVYGQRREFDQYSEENNYVGWTYSLEAMEELGIKNVKLIDGQWTPADEFNGKKIFTVKKIED